MARLIAPQQAGSTVDLRGPRGSTLTATAPDGLQVRVPAPNGKITLWLPQPGEWTYSWDGGPSGTITVTADPAPRTQAIAAPRPRTPARRWQ